MKLSDLNLKDIEVVDQPEESQEVLRLSDLKPGEIDTSKGQLKLSQLNPNDLQTQEYQAPGALESALRGFEQGATFGFGDEINGAIAAAKEAAGTDTPFLQEIAELYRKHRDESRARMAAAEEEHPYLYTGANIAGGIADAALMAPLAAAGAVGGGAAAAANATKAASNVAKVINAAKVGAAGGAVAGAGTSEADVTKGDVKEFAQDVVSGAGSGALLGGTIQGAVLGAKGLVGGVSKAVKDSTPGIDFGDAYNYGKGGVNLVSKKGAEEARERLFNAGELAAETAKEFKQAVGNKYQSTLAQIKNNKLDFSSQKKALTDLYDELIKSPDSTERADAVKIKKLLDDFFEGREVEKTRFAPGKVVGETPSAAEAERLKWEKINASRRQQGLPEYDVAETTSTAADGTPLRTFTGTAQGETVDAAERAIVSPADEVLGIGASEKAYKPVIKDGEIVGYQKRTSGAFGDDGPDLTKNYKDGVKASTIVDDPGNPAAYTEIKPETYKVREGGIDPTQMTVEEARKFKGALNNINGTIGESLQSNTARNTAKRTAGDVVDNLHTNVKPLADTDTQYRAVMQAFDELGIPDVKDAFVRDATGNLRLSPKARNNMFDRVKQYAEETAAGAKSKFRIDQSIKDLEQIDPQRAQAVKGVLEEASKRYGLVAKAQGLGLLNKATYIKSGSVQLGNRLGMAAKEIADYKQAIAQATPQKLLKAAQVATNMGAKGLKIAQELAHIAKLDNSDVKRNALLFSMQQNPAYRETLEELFTGE